MKKLTAKEQGFAESILFGETLSDAYRENYKCGNMNNNAISSAASRIRNRPHVDAYIAEVTIRVLDKIEITAEKVLQELALIGFGNIQNLYDDEGHFIPIHKLPANVAKTITEVTERVVSVDGADKALIERKYKVADKKSSLELLGKNMKLFTDKVDLSVKGKLTLEELISAAAEDE